MIVWIIGIAGSGKSTLAKLMHTSLLKKNKPTVLIDGDQIREIFSYDLDYTIEGRLKNAKRIMHLCKLLDTNNINVICAILSISESDRGWCRKNFSDYTEIYIKTDINFIQKRGCRKIYEDYDKGLIKNVVGKDIYFEEPKKPNLIIHNNLSKNLFLEECKYTVKTIIQKLNVI